MTGWVDTECESSAPLTRLADQDSRRPASCASTNARPWWIDSCSLVLIYNVEVTNHLEGDKGVFQGKAALSSSCSSCDTKADLETLFDGNIPDGKNLMTIAWTDSVDRCILFREAGYWTASVDMCVVTAVHGVECDN